MDRWTRDNQNATIAVANRHRDHYTLADLEFIDAFAGEVSDTELATALGRTLFAIWSAKSALRRGALEARRARPARRVERAYTGLPGDEFPE